MKIFMVSFLMITAIFFSAFGGNSGSGDEQDNPAAEFRSRLSEAIDIYYEIEQAFAVDDGKAAAEKAPEFKQKLAAIDAKYLPEGARPGWNEQLQDLQKEADNLVAAKELLNQRKAFLKISKNLIAAVKSYGPLEKPAYLYHCPMALNSGGHWLSPTNEVANPYFGQEMPKCGTLVEKI